MSTWYKKSAVTIINQLGSDINTGLNSEYVEKNRTIYGENKLLKRKMPSIFNIFLKQLNQICFFSVIIIIMLLFYFKYYNISAIVIVTMITNLIVCTWLENNNIRKINVIEKLTSSYVDVIRNGKVVSVHSSELVVGDIVYLKKNRYVPADLRIVESEGLKINEMSVTGENYDVEKFSAKIEETLYNISEMKNMAFKSTKVTHGSGIGIVVEVGMNTQIGKITQVLNDNSYNKHSLLKKVNETINSIALMAIIVAIIISIIALLLGMSVIDIANISLSILLIGIPFQTTILLFLYLFIFTKILSNEKIHLKNLSSIEKLANVSLLFTEKLNIFSKNEMIVKKVYVDNQLYDALNEKNIYMLRENSNDSFDRLIQISLLCNDSTYSIEDDYEEGDIFEIALIKFAQSNLFFKDSINAMFRRVFEIPYDLDKKIKTTINEVDNNYRANVVGSVDSILERCTHILKNGIEVEITEQDIEGIKKAVFEMSKEGLISIGEAYRNFNYEPTLDENIESNLVFVGVVGMINPLKLDAYDAINFCNDNNIRVIVSMEENKIASFEIGKELNLIKNNMNVLSGFELEFMDEKEFRKNIKIRNVYSMLGIKERARIVKHLKDMGYIIASFGSKLTEMPYLKISDLTVAIGEKCSKTIKKISDIYMENIDIVRFLRLFKECKQIMQTILNIIAYLVTCISAGMGIIVLGFAFNQSTILNVNNIIWINFITIIISCIAIMLNYKNTAYCKMKSIDSKLMSNINLNKHVVTGLFIALVSFGGFLYANRILQESAQTVVFAILGIFEVLFAFNFSDGKILFKNLFSNLLLFLNLLIIGIILSVPYKVDFLGLNSIHIKEWSIILILPVVGFFVTHVYRYSKYKNSYK
ncbi:calcium-transporting ATPase 1 [Clostridium tepidiprofundi DSM 19306]|uniref:Calcium-transporting ATPase 1 n=1 Tax=Clostridium tepidiprofundi DSM 19306 TaxID=1121338 RepID=A0A151B3K1_9CLOT|nr:cation transporting ATPase C-terminal domain-containing protein [Clostridium tepidiprofundi]KYH34509.1 calcium-transporting ATPase 1 [Clostridium tepidiprofundi DSM 19306]